MMKILIPTDFSDNSWCTIKYTIQLMNQKDCCFSFLHAYNIPNSSSGEIIALNDELKANANKQLLSLKERAEALAVEQKHKFMHYAIHGDFLRVVTRFLNEEQMDLMAISLTNHYNPDGIEHGDYAKHIIESIECPVIVVPGKSDIDLEKMAS